MLPTFHEIYTLLPLRVPAIVQTANPPVRIKQSSVYISTEEAWW